MTYDPSNSITDLSSCLRAFLPASIPKTSTISGTWLLVVLVWSMSSCCSTSIRLMPSVSSIHSFSVV